LKTRKAAGGKSQADRDADGIQAILEAIPEGGHVGTRRLRDLVGMGDDRFSRLLSLLVKDGKVKIGRRRKKGVKKPIEVVSRVGTEVGTEVGIDQ
jgi:hypothetical protein